MKKIITLLLLFVAIFAFNGCKNTNIKQVQQEVQNDLRYKLYPTQNMWTFLKLDTRTGKIWQVQYSVDDDNFRGEIVLNDVLLITSGELKDGRLNLHPTLNIFNFILLDQIDGKMWQVQWSTEEENRGIISLNSK